MKLKTTKEPNNVSTLFKYIAYLTLLLALGLIILALYWSFYPYIPLKVNYPDDRKLVLIANEDKLVKSGSYLILNLDFCKYTTDIPQVSTWFVDGVLYQLSDTPAVSKNTGCQTLNLQLYVPKAIPAGEFSIKRTYHYNVNPLRNVDVTLETEKFTIIK
jgi:hypothetical protein